MKIAATSIDVDAPLEVTFNYFTDFEALPQFLYNVTEVRRLSENRFHWRGEISCTEIKEGEIEIEELIPSKLIRWRSVFGPRNSGILEFESPHFNKTSIMFFLIYEPEGEVEKEADAWGIYKVQVDLWLNDFKEFVHQRQALSIA